MATSMTRRTFAKAAAAATVGLTCAGGASAFLQGIPAAKALAEEAGEEGMWTRTTCSPNCTGACGMKAYVHDGLIRMINPAADYPYEQYNPRGCLRGLSINTLVHGPDRLTTCYVAND